MEEKNTFSYSPRDVEKAKRIRKEYSSEKSAMDELDEIGRRVHSRAMIPSISLGLISALVLGIGMCLSMLTSFLIQGIVIGLAGIAGACLVPLFYRKRIETEKSRVADRVMELSGRIING